MKSIFKIGVAILVIGLFASIVGTLYYYIRISKGYEDVQTNVFSENPKYHFSLILNNEKDEYWKQFREGVFDAARLNNIVIEYNPTAYTDSHDTMLEYINIANKARLDGIIVNGISSLEYTNSISSILENDISVVLAGDEPIEDSNLCYVGTNYYELGVHAAQMISQIDNEDIEINLAIIFSGEEEKAVESAVLSHDDSMVMGLNSIEDTRYTLNIVATLYRSSDLLGAEDLTRNILNNYKDIDVIFCTNAKDTISAARVLVERNLVGKIAIVGTNINEEIISLVEKGIISGILDRNGYDAGYKSVEALINNIEGEFQSNFIPIDIDIYTKMNIHKYKEN